MAVVVAVARVSGEGPHPLGWEEKFNEPPSTKGSLVIWVGEGHSINGNPEH